MIKVKKEGVVLNKTQLTFENDSVLNPGIYQDGTSIHMLYRAVKTGNYSTVGYCRLDGPLNVVERYEKPIISPLTDEEVAGVEDPRIVKIDGVYYITYTAYDGVNALGALITSTDLKEFKREGIITPRFSFDEFKELACKSDKINAKYLRYSRHFDVNKKVYLWDKDVIYFPRKIKGKFVCLHRIKPGIQVAFYDRIEDLTKEYWTDYFLHFKDHIILDPIDAKHESSYIGGGCPPIETEDGWLLIYHGVYDTPNGYVYTTAVALLDLENPVQVLARLPYPLFQPEEEYELNGVVNNVVFPTGTALFDDTLYIYYGAADKCIACASVSLKELLKELQLNKTTS